jgi:hypothetical protein
VCSSGQCQLPKGYKLLTYYLDDLTLATEYTFTAADGIPKNLTAGAFVNVVTVSPDQLLTIELADKTNPAVFGPYVVYSANLPAINPDPAEDTPIDLEELLPSPPMVVPPPIMPPDPQAFDPAYASIGHFGYVALHYINGPEAYQVNFPSFLSPSAYAISIGVEGNLPLPPPPPPMNCTTFTTSGFATVATKGAATDNALLYVSYFGQKVVGSQNLSLNYPSLGTPQNVTAAEIGPTAWLVSNATSQAFISRWGLGTAVGLTGQAPLPPGTIAMGIDGGQVNAGIDIAVTVDGPPQLLWYNGNGTLANEIPQKQTLDGTPKQVRMTLADGNTTWVAITSPPEILGYTTGTPSPPAAPPRKIDLAMQGQPIDFVVSAPDLCVPDGGVSGLPVPFANRGFIHVLVAL